MARSECTDERGLRPGGSTSHCQGFQPLDNYPESRFQIDYESRTADAVGGRAGLVIMDLTYRDLPAVIAALNGLAGLLLVSGYVLIKRGREAAHKRVMLGAFGV